MMFVLGLILGAMAATVVVGVMTATAEVERRTVRRRPVTGRPCGRIEVRR